MLKYTFISFITNICQNPGFEALPGEKPPLLVMVHGGPTARAETQLRLDVQYYTTRGFAVLDVDYRGSAMRGRNYRDALHHKFVLLISSFYTYSITNYYSI